MKSSEYIKEKIRGFEGFVGQAYRCPAGVWTIGFGHTGADVKRGQCITYAEAIELFERDLERTEAQVNDLAARSGVSLSQNQFDALVCFTFNLGIGNLAASTLWRKAKADVNDPTIEDEFRRWVYGTQDGQKVRLPGLVNRRETEARLWARK